ncbi:hypothetical protein AM629_06490 [Photorhabdus heterorhabditis]|uniref:Uncharacterized protein n=1 Tax=Photorhabdus heterorhabditis TaxID=880156 RepID=A0ABR5KEL4_9GAMM|nr:hypothetical protein [Photorhabdus heterorhabditis]KOY62855.1 hypothetical protein AM629_06490 [Photorhabdus heterorhabditis]
MLWISTAVENLGKRVFRVAVWATKHCLEAHHKMEYTVDMTSAINPKSQDELRVELLCGFSFLLSRTHKLEPMRDGRHLMWQTASTQLQHFLLKTEVTDDLQELLEYTHTRFYGVRMMPMQLTMRNVALSESSKSWYKTKLPYITVREVLNSPIGDIEVTQSALVKFAKLCMHDANAGAIHLLQKRLNTPELKEYHLPDAVREQKIQRNGATEFCIYFHALFPTVKFQLVKSYESNWRLVDVYSFDHRKKHRAQAKIKIHNV